MFVGGVICRGKVGCWIVVWVEIGVWISEGIKGMFGSCRVRNERKGLVVVRSERLV